MAFDIQGRLVLTGPFPSASQMAQDIQRQLNNISVNVQLNLPQNSVAQITQANQAINSVNAAAQQLNTQVNAAGSSVGQLGTKIGNVSRTSITSLKELEGSVRDTANAFTTFSDQVGYVTKRFAAYAVAATAIVSVSQAIKNGISDAIAFQNELVKLSQIGENSANNIRAIASSVTELSQKYGVASKDLIASAVTLRQAGLDAKQTAIALETLAQAATSPNFDNMARNTEGAIAVMNQFRLTATDLQRSFSSINAVAADFPVAARDIQEAIIRTGGVFSQLGGNLNEFIALFTSVKSVTQESSESIASGLRNIFTRLQSESTLDTLREFRINLRYTAEEARSLGNINFTNQFVGAAEAVKRIQTGLRDLSPTDPRFARIIEAVGGTRQIGRALPLISQQGAGYQQRALNVAEGGGASLAQSAERGLASLSRQATQTSEKFQELFRVITNSEGFTGLAGGLLAFGTRLAEVLKLLTPAIPLFTTLAAIKFGEGLFNFAATRGVAPLPNAGRFAQGGYASGGLSYLMPGEAVIPPINAAKLGYGSLRKLNEGGGFLSANNGFIVPGVGNQDSELHDLAPGSFVIRKSSVNKIRGYADGGWTSVDTSNDQEPYRFDSKYVRKLARGLSVKSGIDFNKLVPLDRLFAESYGSGFGGVANHIPAYGQSLSSININKSQIFSPQQLLKVLSHEYGHAADLYLGKKSGSYRPSQGNINLSETSSNIGKILNSLEFNKDFKHQINPFEDEDSEYNQYTRYIQSPHEKFAELFSESLGVRSIRLDSDSESVKTGRRYLRKNFHPLLPQLADGGIPDEAEGTWKDNVGRISKNRKNIIALEALQKGLPIGQMTGNFKNIEYPDFSQMPTKLQRSGFDNGGIARYGFGDVVKNLIGNVTGLFRKKENIPTAMFTPPTTIDSPSNVPQVVEQALAQAKTVAPRFGVESDKSTAFKPSFTEEKNSNAESYALAIQNLNSLLNAVGVESFQSDLFNSPTLRQIGVSNPDNLDALLRKIRIRIEQASNFSSKAGFDSATSVLIQKKAELDALKAAVAGFQENLSIPVVDVSRVNNSSEEVIKHALELLGQGKAGSEVKESLSSTFGIASSTAAKYLSRAKKAGGYASGGRIESDSFYKSYFASAYQALGRRTGIDFNQIVGLDKINVSSLLKKNAQGQPVAGGFSGSAATGEGAITFYPRNTTQDSETDDGGHFLRTLIHELGHGVDFKLGQSILGSNRFLSGDSNKFRGPKSPNLNNLDLSVLPFLQTRSNFTGRKKESEDYYNGPNELFAELFVRAVGAEHSRNRLKNSPELTSGIDELKNRYFPLLPQFAKGGLSPLDRVPALLTPGEFVVNPETTARLGVANLDRVNKGGSIDHIKGFNRGGFVGSYATGGPLQAIDEFFAKLAVKFNQLGPNDSGSSGANIAKYGLPIIGGVADSFKSANIEQRGFFTTSKGGEVGYDYQKLLKHYKDLESVVQKQVEYENKNLSAAEKRQLTEDRLNQIKIKASQYSALGSQFQANRGEIKSLLDVQALFATGKPGAQPLTVQETNRLAELQNENQQIQARLRDAQKSLTFGFGKDEKGKDVIQEVDGRGSSANFFQGLFGKGTNVEARNARLQAASTSLILASSYAGDILGRSAGNPEDVARNGVGGFAYTTGKALSQASIYGGIGFSVGNAISPGFGGVVGAGIGAGVGTAEGVGQSLKELDLAKFALEITRSTNALNSFVGSIDRINKSFTDSEISQIQRDVGGIVSNASQSFTREQTPGAISRLFTAATLPYNVFEETQQNQSLGSATLRSIARFNAIPDSVFQSFGRETSSDYLERTENSQQSNIRLQAINTRNPQAANAIVRNIEGFDANQLVNNRDLTLEQRNAAIRQRFSTRELSLAATSQGIFNTAGTENQINRYFESQTTRNQRTAVERNLILSGGTSATAYLELGFKRFADNLSHAAESLESFGRNAESVVQLLSGGTQFSRYSAPTALLNSPIGTSQYFNAVSSATAGLGGPGQTLSRLGNVTGRLGEIGPEVLGNYLSQGANGPTLERRLLDRLQIEEGTQESAVVRNIAQSVSSIGEGDRNRFATPFAREQLFQQELAKYNQSLVSIAQQQERIVNAEVASRQQILNLTLKRQEFLGRAVDLDAQSLQFSAQQRAIRTFGSGDAAINQITERQANSGFYSRINEAGRGVGPRGSSITSATSLTDIFSLAQNALQNRNRLLSDTSSPVGTNRRAITEFENQLISATRILEIYANGTSRLSALQEKLNLVTQDRSNRIEGQRRFITGSDEDRAQTLQDRYVFEYIRNAGDAQQRTSAFNQLGQPGQAAYLRYSDQFRNVRFDANSTIGQEADRQLNATIPGNITESLNSEQDRLASQITAILENASTANNLLAALNNSTAAQLQTEATNFNTEALRTLSEQLERLKSFGERQTAENVGGVAGRALSQVAGTPGFASIQNTLGNLGYNLNSLGSSNNRADIRNILSQTPFGSRTEGAGNTLDLLEDISKRESRNTEIQRLNVLRRRTAGTKLPPLTEDSTDEELAAVRLQYQNSGGMIYANRGIFQPRGTDTVPAMLTPGEMVVNATSTAANRELLERINNAKGPVLYRSEGGAAEYFRRSGLTDFFNMFRRNQRVTETSSRSTGPNYQDPAYQARLNQYLNAPSPYTGSSEPEIAATPEVSGPKVSEAARAIANTVSSPKLSEAARASANAAANRTIADNPAEIARFNAAADSTPFSPLGFQGDIGRFGGRAAAYNFQQRATDNLLRQQLLSQTQTTGLYGTNLSGQLALAQRQQQAQTFANITQQNRRFLTYQTPQNPNQQLLQYLRGARRFASGGMVEGEDNVPAFLSEGEFVMNRSATRNIGANNLYNLQRFANGGLVGNGTNAGGNVGQTQNVSVSNNDSAELIGALTSFSQNNQELVDALKGFPHTIELNATHKVEVIINGAAAFETMQETFRDMAIGLVDEKLQTFVKDNFPSLQ